MREIELKIINSFIKVLDSYNRGNPLPYKNLKLFIEAFETNLLTEQQYYEYVWTNL